MEPHASPSRRANDFDPSLSRARQSKQVRLPSDRRYLLASSVQAFCEAAPPLISLPSFSFKCCGCCLQSCHAIEWASLLLRWAVPWLDGDGPLLMALLLHCRRVEEQTTSIPRSRVLVSRSRFDCPLIAAISSRRPSKPSVKPPPLLFRCPPFLLNAAAAACKAAMLLNGPPCCLLLSRTMAGWGWAATDGAAVALVSEASIA
ncbi:hypothetical protein Dimus_026345 [Dionaea muscipula]